ncbi:helix-turn-helix domain-containing protein [Chryseobacterium rhizoplanae]|uniref:helix-turn-helix domain-containing protein n=1 Tax=Chryseobacterium rhizoplanae TaxID=1609531 RepID=UPI001157A9BB|nr:helix-turn-helix domain-containing protein [Chryseobacterium rhizoplanae]
MMKYIFPIIILLFNNLADAQNHNIDSLSEFKYSQLKNKFYDYYDHNQFPQSEQIAKYYLQKAKKEKNALEIAEGYNLIHFNKDFPVALKYIDSIAAITKDIKGSFYPARTLLIKGNLYYKNDNLKAALDSYILGLKYAKEQNDERQIAYADINIAYINSYIGKNAEAAKIFRRYLYNRNDITDDYQHNQMRIALISCYLDINKLDSANILIREGQISASISKNNYDINLYSFLSAKYDLKQRKYKTAITKLSKVYDDIVRINPNNANNALYNLGKAYDGLKNKEKVVETYTKLDSNVQKTNITFPELREVYTYLIDYYKEKNDKEKQLYYIDRFLKVDKKLDEQFQYLSTELPKKYDTPNLLQEKEEIINDLKNKKIILYASIVFLLLILLLVVYLYYKAKKTAKEHRKIAQELIHSIEKRNSESTIDIKKEIPELYQIPEHAETENIITKTVPEEVTLFILNELETFENKQLFLKNGITLVNLAKNIKTNTSYLSETINNHKGKNFTSYLNDLRIDYVLERLVKDKKFRSYKLPAIAEEIGYNNVQAFAVAFKKKTGTTPSIYIKEIENSTTV